MKLKFYLNGLFMRNYINLHKFFVEDKTELWHLDIVWCYSGLQI